MTTTSTRSAVSITGSVPAELATALRSVSSALALLRRDPRAPDVVEAVRRGQATVDQLAPGVTAVVLRRLLASIEECHRQGVTTSIRLGARTRAARYAIRLEGPPHG
jgi:hypothetical protein